MRAPDMTTFLRWIGRSKARMRSITEVYDKYGTKGLVMVKKAKSDGTVELHRLYTGDGGYRLYVEVKGDK